LSVAPGERKNIWIITKKDFTKFCTDISRYDPDELVKRYSISYAQAETLVPALIGYRNLIDRTKAERIHVLSVSIRDGILLDMARREFGAGLESFERQILTSARALAAKYHCNENHIEQVRMIALSLFDQLQSEHGLERSERLFLEVAALVHDVGSFISPRAHHKHSYYIISSSEVFGLSRSDLNLIANIARYHRKSAPTQSHIPYTSLDRESRVIVSKLAAILRVADALDQDYSRKVKKVKIVPEVEDGRYVLEVEAEGDLVIETLALDRKSDLFKAIYGKPVALRQVEKIE
jgi:exopolyphosphatase/guanosine-5'-triphosphate,3'-diphosphate pyrophosphatase